MCHNCIPAHLPYFDFKMFLVSSFKFSFSFSNIFFSLQIIWCIPNYNRSAFTSISFNKGFWEVQMATFYFIYSFLFFSCLRLGIICSQYALFMSSNLPELNTSPSQLQVQNVRFSESLKNFNYRNLFVTQYITYLNIWKDLSKTSPYIQEVMYCDTNRLLKFIEHHCYKIPKSYY